MTVSSMTANPSTRASIGTVEPRLASGRRSSSAASERYNTTTSLSGALREIAILFLNATAPETGSHLDRHHSVMERVLREPELQAHLAGHERESAAAVAENLAGHLPGESAIPIRASREIAAWRPGWTPWEADIQAHGGTTRAPEPAHREAWRYIGAMVGEVGDLGDAGVLVAPSAQPSVSAGGRRVRAMPRAGRQGIDQRLGRDLAW